MLAIKLYISKNVLICWPPFLLIITTVVYLDLYVSSVFPVKKYWLKNSN